MAVKIERKLLWAFVILMFLLRYAYSGITNPIQSPMRRHVPPHLAWSICLTFKQTSFVLKKSSSVKLSSGSYIISAFPETNMTFWRVWGNDIAARRLLWNLHQNSTLRQGLEWALLLCKNPCLWPLCFSTSLWSCTHFPHKPSQVKWDQGLLFCLLSFWGR